MDRGVEKFIGDMQRLGFDSRVEAGLVVYQIEPVDGARSGTTVETGVNVDELKPWPQVPPHWVHLPTDVVFSHTNSEASTKSGWLKHSRELTGWGDAESAICWASHVRSVVCEAIR